MKNAAQNGAEKASDRFLQSLDTLSADDLGPLPPKNKAAACRRIFLNALLVFFVAVFVCSLVYCGWRIVQYRRSKILYDDLLNRFEGAEEEQPVRIGGAAAALSRGKASLAIAALPASRTERTENGQTDTDADFLASVQLQLAALRKINGDIGGWIRMQGDTAINYPFVFSHDDSHYLTYAADGSYNPAGAIFLDCRNKKTFSENCNTVLYGHNMYSGSPMFSNLHKFSSDPNYWKNNHFVELYTDEGSLLYVVFAAYSDSPQFEENCYFDTTVKGEERMQAFLDRIAQRNILKTSVTVGRYDKVLTLVTCADAGANRFVVHAKRIEDRNDIH